MPTKHHLELKLTKLEELQINYTIQKGVFKKVQKFNNALQIRSNFNKENPEK